MGKRFAHWKSRSAVVPSTLDELEGLLLENRSFSPVTKLDYGDHGLHRVVEAVVQAIRSNRRIALYADYDVDGTMSCVSWIWFLQFLGYSNYVPYIPCRFKEGYGVNLSAVRHLLEVERAQMVITMDTGITANTEAEYCRSQGVDFLCTDHHKIQPEKMPDCLLLNPKLHPHPDYQELCGCGITFVLLRRVGEKLGVPPQASIWTDLLALAGMATICDVVPLNPVNHRLARLGVSSLLKSHRRVFKRLREAASLGERLDETDVGFRLGPRINAVGRLEHAELVVQAFIDENPEPLVAKMGECNERRRHIQDRIVQEARREASLRAEAPILFLGGDWHPGVVGIAASKIAEEFWKPTWLFQRGDLCKGSARSVPGFDVTDAMVSASSHFLKFGGHAFAGGFTFDVKQEPALREALEAYGHAIRRERPELWQSALEIDCRLPTSLLSEDLLDRLEGMRPFGNRFPVPRFEIDAEIIEVNFYRHKQTGEPKHTAVDIRTERGPRRVVFFHEVWSGFEGARRARLVATAARNQYRGKSELQLIGEDWSISNV